MSDGLSNLQLSKAPILDIGDYKLITVGNTKELFRIFFAVSHGYEISAHHELELLLVLEGNLKVETEGIIYNLLPMDLIVINPNKVHILDNPGQSEIIVLQVLKEHVAQLLGTEDYLFKNYYPKNRAYDLKMNLMNLLMTKYEANENHNDSYVLLEKIILALELEYNHDHEFAHFKDSKEIVHNVVERLSFNINLSLDQLAKEYHISYSHLSREFLSVIGIHFTDYVRKAKMNTAIHRLINTNKSITEVATDSGFANSQLFSRNFKEAFNMTPSEFRKMHQKPSMKEMPTEVVDKLKIALADIHRVKMSSQTEMVNYSVEPQSVNYPNLHRTWGSVVDLDQFVFGQFQIDEFLETLAQYRPKVLRVSFKLIDGKFHPILGEDNSKPISKLILDKLFTSVQDIGVSLLIRVHLDVEDQSSNGYYVMALNSILDYISMKMGLPFLETCSFEFYNASKNIMNGNYVYLANVLIKQAKLRVSHDIKWGLHIGSAETMYDVHSIVNGPELKPLGLSPDFLSFDLMFTQDKREMLGVELMENSPFEYLIDFVYCTEGIHTRCDPITEAIYCIRIIEVMQSVNFDFHLISWEIQDSKSERRVKPLNALGIETVQYYFMFFMSKMYKKMKYIKPGLILSNEGNDNYNLLVFSNDQSNLLLCTGTDSNKKIIPHNINLKGITGRYKVIEKRIPLCSFSAYFNWLDELEADVLSSKELCHIRKKVMPELKVSVIDAPEDFDYEISLRPVDIVLLRLQKI